MIRSFKDKDTEAIFNGKFVRRIPKQVAPLAARKLNQVHAAGCLEDLRIPPGNRLEALKGDRKGQHSIRINDQAHLLALDVSGAGCRRDRGLSLARSNMGRRDFTPIHPGEVLLHDFMEPMGISQYRVAKEISVPPRRINQIVHGERAISADTALRLSRYFGLSDQYWLNLQSLYDLQVAKEQLQETLDSIEPLAA